jgi:hypothetical protein
MRIIKTIVAVKTIKGTQFVGIRNYTNQQGEISNQTFLIGINYTNLLKSDLETLKNFDINTLSNKYDINTLTQGYTELITSLEKRLLSDEQKAELLKQNDKTIKLSEAQKNAYINIGNGIKINKDEQTLHVYGLAVKKTILKAGEYKQTKSTLKTIIKNENTKIAKLKSGKFRDFKIGNIGELQINGVTI